MAKEYGGNGFQYGFPDTEERGEDGQIGGTEVLQILK